MSNRLEVLPAKERRGSRARCILLTDGTGPQVANRITSLVAPYALVNPERHVWTPRGLSNPAEVELGGTPPFLSDKLREDISNWWLIARHPSANTPNWDIVSQATINGREGLILIEAKAHDNELKNEERGKPLDPTASQESRANHDGIGKNIHDASKALSSMTGLDWRLSRDSHYQMCNRFAWAWKLTTMMIPVILVYLGFLKTDEMRDRGLPIARHEDWKRLVEYHSEALFPNAVWENSWSLNGTQFIPLIRSAELSLDVED